MFELWALKVLVSLHLHLLCIFSRFLHLVYIFFLIFVFCNFHVFLHYIFFFFFYFFFLHRVQFAFLFSFFRFFIWLLSNFFLSHPSLCFFFVFFNFLAFVPSFHLSLAFVIFFYFSWWLWFCLTTTHNVGEGIFHSDDPQEFWKRGKEQKMTGPDAAGSLFIWGRGNIPPHTSNAHISIHL